MCCFFIVIKLLMLKILLAGLTGLITASRYDYSYQPSAEEFDNLLRDTRRTWTNSLLKAERDRLLVKPVQRDYKAEARYFVPKFHYENSESVKFNGFMQKPLKKHNLQLALPQKYSLPLQNIGSSLEFNYFSDELPDPVFTKPLRPQTNLATTTIDRVENIKPISSAKLEIIGKPLAKPGVLSPLKYSLNKLYKNNTLAGFPIYFANPATGLVYAITEVGTSTGYIIPTNGTIPIFITKDQHERDIMRLQQAYKQKCQNLRITTTTGPLITKLQKPLAPVIPITSSKFSPTSADPKPLSKPSPIIVKTELIVKDKKPAIVTRPLRKKQNKPKPKLKVKKHKSPGHKTLSTTVRTIIANHPEGPKIILGRRTLAGQLYKDKEKLPTQLEKPDFDNIFSGTRLTHYTISKAGTVTANKHKINKRSIEKGWEKLEKLWKAEKNASKSWEMKYFKNSEKSVLRNSYKIESNIEHNYSIEMEKISKEIKKKLSKNSNKENANVTQKFSKKSLNFMNATAANLTKSIKNLNVNNSDLKIEKNPLENKEIERKFQKIVNDSLNTIYKNQPKNETNFKAEKENNLNIFKDENLSKILKYFYLNNALENETTNEFQTTLKTLSGKNLIKSSGDLKTKKNPFNSNKINLKEINTKNSIKRSIRNTFLKDLKHHLKKRSTEDLTKNNYTLPKFIKKSNKIRMNQKNFTANDLKSNKQNSKQPNNMPSNITLSINSTEIKKNLATKLPGNGNGIGTLKRFKKLKKLSKVRINNSSPLKTAARTNKPSIKSKKIKKKSPKGKQDAEYYFFNLEENYDEDESEEEEYEYDEDDDDEEQEEDSADKEEEEEVEDYKQQNEILAYDDESYPTHTVEAGLSVEDLHKKPTQDSSSSPEQDTENSVLKIEKLNLRNPLLHYNHQGEIVLKPTHTYYVKKRYRRRRPPKLQIREDYENDDEDDDDDDDYSVSSHVAGFFRMIFYPLQLVMSSVMDSMAGKEADEEEDDKPTYAHYTPYHKTLQQHSSDEYDEDYDSSQESSGSTLSNWISSWFAFNRRNKKIGSTTVAPVKLKTTKTSSSWLPSWLSFGANDRISTDGASSEDYNDYDKWFASWFGEMKPKARKRTTTTTSTTTQIPHVPILTIVDPMRNPENWIGILAHHIINHTSTSTANPLKDIWNKVTSTTTENPEIPRRISYDKYQIWRLKPQGDSQVKALEEYKKSEDGIKLHWLKGPSLRGLTDVLVPPKMLMDFQASLTFELIDHEVLIFDVGKAIAYEKSKEDYFISTTQKPKKHHLKNPTAIAAMTWHKYYEYDDIIKYLETMRMRFPYLVDLIHIGRSYEGRPLIVMKIESKEAAAVNAAHYTAHQRNKLHHKKRIGLANAVFIEAGTHGMEWIGPATATWIINELLRIMKKNVTDDQGFIRNTTWYIMPVLNPDGYVYSHEYDRFWKKSRSRHISRPSGILSSAMTWLQKKRAKEKVCFGVDLDRNWHYQWGKRGSSKSACNEFYAGPKPFSEPESKALSEFVMDYKTQIKLFVSMQSYGQIISYPYKANTTYDAERLDDLLDVAMVGTDALRKKGSKSRYKVDSSNDLVENRSGCSDAFAAYEAGIPFSYTLQLADNGVHGYLLPSASIESTAKDAFEIIRGMLDYI